MDYVSVNLIMQIIITSMNIFYKSGNTFFSKSTFDVNVTDTLRITFKISFS